MRKGRDEEGRVHKAGQEKKKFSLKWQHMIIIAVSVCVCAVAAVFISVSLRLRGGQGTVSGWSELKAKVGTLSSSGASPAESSSAASNAAASHASASAAASESSSQASSAPAVLTDADFDSIKAKNYPIISVARRDKNIENILLIGIDGGDPGEDIGHRSDCMIVLSINTKNNTVKLTSILRDIKAYFPDLGAWGKLNSAYAYGGAGQTVNIINYNFKLDIQKYVLVDFSGFRSVIDSVGGVDISVSDGEATQIDDISGAGTYRLTGAQALEYARTRNIDDEYMRTARQRTVLAALYKRFVSGSIANKVSCANTMINYMKTNISAPELLGLFTNYSSKISSDIAGLGVPTEDNGLYTIESSPVWYFNLDWDAERQVITKFIYGS
jgi:LCP family protein required for cell wall assembly